MSDETATLLASLGSQRRHVLGALDGLTDGQLAQPVLPSGWTCLGLVRHLTFDVERFWFREVAAGDPAPRARSTSTGTTGWVVPTGVMATEVLDAYRQEAAIVDGIIGEMGADAAPRSWPDDFPPEWRYEDLRSIVLHVIAETACHAGHLGRCPRAPRRTSVAGAHLTAGAPVSRGAGRRSRAAAAR